jgi:hypothetical protein
MNGAVAALSHPLVAALIVTSLTAMVGLAGGTFAVTYRNHRILTGEDGVEHDPGLVGEVHDLGRETERNSRALREMGARKTHRTDSEAPDRGGE